MTSCIHIGRHPDRTKFILVRAVLLVCIAWGDAYAASYYVDASHGNDANTGLSATVPWRTVAKVNAHTFNPGDSILFKRGEQWREMLLVFTGGTSANHLVIGAYGDGPKPILSGADLVTGWIQDSASVWRAPWSANPGSVWFVAADGSCSWGRPQSTAGFLSTAASVDRDWAWASGWLYVHASASPAAQYASVEAAAREFAVVGVWDAACRFVELRDLELRFTWHQCLKIAEGDVSTANTDWIVDGIAAHHNGISGANDMLGFSISGDRHVIRNCEVYEAVGNGITIILGKGNVVEHNTVYNNHHNQIDLKPPASASASDANHIRYNHVYIDAISAGVTGITPYTNGIYVLGLAEGTAPTYLYYNIVHDLNQRGIQIDGWADVVVENNVVANCGQYDFYLNNYDYPAAFRNNIGVNMGDSGSSDARRILRVFDITNKTFDYNCWHWNLGTFAQIGTYVDYSSWAAYRAATGFDAHSLTSDPQFADAATNNFHVQAASPCIDNGVLTNWLTDYDGHAVPVNAKTDIGAFEYAAYQPPTAAFNATPLEGKTGLAVAFTDESDPGSAAAILEWAWDFGDGAFSNDPSPVHVYGIDGVYSVSLTVTTEWGSHTLVKPGMIRVSMWLPAESRLSALVLCAAIAIVANKGLRRNMRKRAR